MPILGNKKRDPHVWNAELASEMLLRPPCPVHNTPMNHVFLDGFLSLQERSLLRCTLTVMMIGNMSFMSLRW